MSAKSDSSRKMCSEDMSLLLYAQHMANASRVPEARRLFQSFVAEEVKRMGLVFDPSKIVGLQGTLDTENSKERMMKAMVDQNICTGCELCPDTCPEVFEMDGDTARVKVDVVPPAAEDTCQVAKEGCPVGAISIEA